MPVIDTGHRYNVAPENFSVTATSGLGGANQVDLFQVLAAASVPIFVDYIKVSGNLGSGTVQRLQVLRRTTASTTGTGITAKPASPTSPASVSTCLYNLVVGLGTASDIEDSEEWNQFSNYEYDRNPCGIFVPPGGYLNIFLPQGPLSPFNCSVAVSFIELR